MAVITSLSGHDDTSAVSDLRARIEQQLIAAAKSGRRKVPFGELFEQHGKNVFGVVHWMMQNREDGDGALDLSSNHQKPSEIPRVTTDNTMAPCVIIGERAGKILREEHKL